MLLYHVPILPYLDRGGFTFASVQLTKPSYIMDQNQYVTMSAMTRFRATEYK